MQEIEKLIYALFAENIHSQIDKIELLQASGSNRKYFRIFYQNKTLIGVYNDDRKENEAFIGFTKHFLHKGFNVPKIFGENLDQNVYLLEDLGDETLYSFLCKERQNADGFSSKLINIYKQTLDGLIDIQLRGSEGIDFSLCYPRSAFDRQSINWDLNYFKYYFLKLAKIPFNEQLLENDFNTLTDYLLEAKADYFLYRDFQSRNIMLKDDKVFFIDYQGGRRGALQYDVASLLYDGKADIPQDIREELLTHYINRLQAVCPQAAENFKDYYYAFVFVRIMQAMGSYGFRGFYEKKTHFLQSIPYALNNLKWLLANVELKIHIPELWQVFHQLIHSETLNKISQPKLTVKIYSFSFKNQQPIDNSGHGGGFVFDCRCLPNPGRYEAYQHKNGYDQEVIEFLETKSEITLYFEYVKSLVDLAVRNYIERGFLHLSISFGCTGGQHRSVYFANRLAQYIQKYYNVNVETIHLMQQQWIR